MNFVVYITCVTASYLLGAVPSGLIVAQVRGVDIRTVGSGNIGATNVLRSVGKPWGYLTFFCDAAKGFTSSFVFPFLAVKFLPDIDKIPLGICCAGAAVIGHNWPIYLHFKGGKGIAVSAGALLGITPMAVSISLAIWIIAFLCTRYVSVASILGAGSIAASAWLLYYPQTIIVPVSLTVLAGLAIWRHRINIRRLMQGTENRFKRKKKGQQ
ncbi:MAG: glycerol-3-phosphate 1-O-acyltransferase PlsY [Lentisphaerae bacterium]|nr:glycerol-3-phosphate 1-O-acyltransferase PlsY [Lentisphaerota bacterium]